VVSQERIAVRHRPRLLVSVFVFIALLILIPQGHLCHKLPWRRFRLADRSAGSDHARRSGHGGTAVFAEFEREILRAGLAHARQNGKRLGRPATAAVHADRVRKLRRSGLSKSAIARRLHIGRTSVWRILKERIRS
jgi:hypothetical protein